jgi:diguanylate cyclase (GGDEF)-like protein
VLTAADGEEALRLARERTPSLVILDVMMPKLDGYEVCQHLRTDGRTSGVCVIMLTARSMPAEKVLGLTAGADDYIGKPFDPMELVARVKTTLRRSREMRAVSPLTGLPGNVQIEGEIRRRAADGETFGVLWLDLDNFKAYNDKYGFVRGDRAINYLAACLREVAGDSGEFYLGHIGGDDFVVLLPGDRAEGFCKGLVDRFDRDVAELYDPDDAAKGGITVTDRLGREITFPLLTVSIGAATNEYRDVSDYRELVETATEMKAYSKAQVGSYYSIDRRGRPNEGSP